MTNKTITMEIHDILCRELFMAYHEEVGGHALMKHINVSDNDLQRRVRKHYDVAFENKILAFSRFNGSIEEVLPLIHQCLIENQDEIEKWIEWDDPQLELNLDFSDPIGKAAVVGTQAWKYFDTSRICVVVKPSPIHGRHFVIRTAYPTFNNAERQIVRDAKDAWQTKFRCEKTDRKKNH